MHTPDSTELSSAAAEPRNNAHLTSARPGRRRSSNHRHIAAGLLSGLVLAGLFWRGAHAQVPVGPPPMPLAYEFVASPNFGERPVNSPINTIVLHATVEPTTEGTVGIFLNPARQVSAHFVVGRDGRIIQMVPIEKRAWHAGVSTWDGMNDINNVSVGIEMVNLNDGKDPYPDAQYQAVAGIIRFVRSRYLVPDEHIVSHEQIALPKGRKSDPVGFDFARIKGLARMTPGSAPPPPSAQPVTRGNTSRPVTQANRRPPVGSTTNNTAIVDRDISRANKTLDNMVSLLDQIEARKKSRTVPPAG